jgi:hypothetical protein
MAHPKKLKKHYTLDGYTDFPQIWRCSLGVFKGSSHSRLAQRSTRGTIGDYIAP